jgi:nucleoside-diphosphate kinase
LAERTLSLIKPDAVGAGNAGRILTRIEENGFRIVAMRLVRMTRGQAEEFYGVHRQRPFFPGLCDFISSGPCIALVLEKDGAISRLRGLMGATDPQKAAQGTIRKDFGASVVQNAIHGADSSEAARVETQYFFSGLDLAK